MNNRLVFNRLRGNGSEAGFSVSKWKINCSEVIGRNMSFDVGGVATIYTMVKDELRDESSDI
jgi:hypothetical protein